MIVIDACASRVLVEAMADGKLPNFKALAETGYFSPNCLSIFPSITHAATASLATPQNLWYCRSRFIHCTNSVLHISGAICGLVVHGPA
jgi:hypothetical protein